MLALLLATLALADDCPDAERKIAEAEQDVVSFYLQDAANFAAESVVGFGCSTKATPNQVARLFQVHGMIRFLQDDIDGASRAFLSARQVDASLWNEDYGGKAREVFDAASGSASSAPASVTVKGLSDGDWLVVNGAIKSQPLSLPPGMHLVQVGSGGASRFAKIIDVKPGTEVMVAVQGGDVVEVVPEIGAVSVIEPAPTDGTYQANRAKYLAVKLEIDADASSVITGADPEWQIRDGHGRSLKAREFAKLVGDSDTHSKLQRRYASNLAVAGTLYTAGGLVLLASPFVAIGEAAANDFSGDITVAPVLALVGLVSLGGATIPAVRALTKQEPRFHYTADEATEKLEAYNASVREALGVEREARLRIRPTIGPAGAGIRGVF